MKLKMTFWLHFWFVSVTMPLPVNSVEQNIFCPAQCIGVTTEAEDLRLHVQC